ncbi:MAG: hypothetical protein P8Y97_00675, partial [Candidatus Lokiarchaeota archaeon]
KKMTKINRERARDPKWREKMSKAITNKWNNPDYKENQMQERKERVKDPKLKEEMTKFNNEKVKESDWIKKMTKINRERARDPKWREKMSKVITNKWNDPDYRRSQIKERRERAKNPEWRKKMRDINKMRKKEIEDKRGFLQDVKEGSLLSDLSKKYNMGRTTISKRIKEMFQDEGLKNYTDLKNYLKDKNVNDVLRSLEKNAESTSKDLKERSEVRNESIPKKKPTDYAYSNKNMQKESEISDKTLSENKVNRSKVRCHTEIDKWGASKKDINKIQKEIEKNPERKNASKRN